VRLLLCLCCLVGTLSADLGTEDLRSVEEVFHKTDPSLTWFAASAKKPIDAVRSVMIVQAAPDARSGPDRHTIGLFIVSGRSNRVLLVIDRFAEREVDGFPGLEQPTANSVNIHFYSDYGIYYGSVKYFFEKPTVKFRYGMLALHSSSVRKGSIVYTGSAMGHGYEVTIGPGGRKITDGPVPSDDVPPPVSLRLADGRTLLVSNTPVGQTHQLAGFAVIDKSGKRSFYAAPVPTMSLDRKMRLGEPAPGEIENDIGPVAMGGSTVWYANRFYDGEGTSGVGAIGAFDVSTGKFEMRYLPAIAAWSGSAIRLDGDDLWVGLMRQPEGAAFSGGLLRYGTKTGVVAKFDVPDYIHTIDRLGDAIYCGTSNGVYVVRDGAVVHTSFEPDANGKLTAVTRTSSQPDKLR
jgi:hypothetical protein